jgi:hypothetical protein
MQKRERPSCIYYRALDYGLDLEQNFKNMSIEIQVLNTSLDHQTSHSVIADSVTVWKIN